MDEIESDLHEHIRNRMVTLVFDIADLLDPLGAKARVAVTGAAVCVGMAAAYLVKSAEQRGTPISQEDAYAAVVKMLSEESLKEAALSSAVNRRQEKP